MDASRNALWCSLLCALAAGCAFKPSGVVYTDSIDPNIENGYVTENSSIAIRPDWTLRLPPNALVKFGGKPGIIEIRQRKELSIAGHPPELISINEMRHRMGVAARLQEHVLEIDSFGSYEIDGAGGARIQLTCTVPEGTSIERSESKGIERKAAAALAQARIGGGNDQIESNGRWTVVEDTESRR
jgi:hypothetical protein